MLPLLLLLSPAPMIDPAEIDRLVAQHLGAAVGQPGGAEQPVDRRLKLARCETPPALTTAGSRGELVKVECPGGWRLFVRSSGSAPGSISVGAAVEAEPAVRRGQEVALRLSGAGFSVSQAATVLEDGAVGAWVRVRRGRDVLRGRVTSNGAVELSPTS